MIKKILITGGAGYVGSILSRELLARGYDIRIVDNFMYDNKYAINDLVFEPRFEVIEGDITKKEVLIKAIADVDIVVHLAAIVGEPACNVNINKAIQINYFATKMLGELAIKNNVKKFIFASTCSVYGSRDDWVDESFPPNPLGVYAESKVAAEEYLKKIFINSLESQLIILRFATLFGWSYRPRFDLVVNFFTAKALKEKQISVYGGDQWRPFLHVRDAVRSIIFFIENDVPRRIDVYNVGNTKLNMTILDLAEIIKEIIPETEINIIRDIRDKRNYKVRFDKIENLGFKTNYDIRDGVKELVNVLLETDIDPYDRRYYNYVP